MRLVCLVACVAVPLFLIGCKPEATPTTGPNNPSPNSNAVAVTDADLDAVDAAVKANKGKVVLVDFWATWCPPCVKTFPHFVSFHEKFSEKGLVCISVSLDKVSARADVVKFLEKNNAKFRNYFLTGGKEKLAATFGYGGFIPYKVMFDKTGNRVNVSEMDEDELAQRLEVELGK